MKTHANHVAAFEQLLGHCNTQRAFYNPSKESMKSTALTTLLAEAQKSIQAVHKAQNDLVTAINHRSRAFEELPFLGTRIVLVLQASDAPPDQIADVNRIRQRFRFQPHAKRATAQTSSPGGQTGQTSSAEASSPSARKISQLDFVSKIDNFTELIGLLENEPAYKPNEAALAIEGLKTFQAGLIEKHEAVRKAKQSLFEARLYRNEMLYGGNGISGIAPMIKKYFGAIKGTKDETYKTVRKIRFAK
jgi:hypothetical protein